MLNGTLVASVGSNALTIAIKTLAGNDPTPGDPVLFTFRDVTASLGDYVVVPLTSALSITVPSTATLGTVNAQANRIWVGIFNNGGTPVLGVWNSISSPGLGTGNIVCWDETSNASGTAIAGGSNSAQTWFTNGTVTTKAFRALGYVESTQATAGTWASNPSKVQLFGPGVKKPGDTIQEIFNFVSGSATTTSATFVALTNENVVINVQSAANLIRVEASGSASLPSATAVGANLRLSRGTTANTNMFGSNANPTTSSGVAIASTMPSSLLGCDAPNVTGNVTYAVQGNISTGTLTYGGNTQIAAREIQI